MNAPQTSTITLNELPEGARIITFGHRSGAETHMRCPRAYYLTYEYLGRGVNPAPGPLYFAVGSAVHTGLASLLLEEGVDVAVTKALEFLIDTQAYQRLQSDQQTEQEVLVHGLVYAFDVWAMPSMRKNYEVICVETGAVEYVPLPSVYHGSCNRCGGNGNEPGSSTSANGCSPCVCCEGRGEIEIINYIAIQSRPDAILRDRTTGEVSGWSWKTIDDPTDLRRSQLHNDLQGFMEMYYGERILEKLAGAPVTDAEIEAAFTSFMSNPRMSTSEKLQHAIGTFTLMEERARTARNIPTRIDSIQTVFLVKGKRVLLDSEEMPWVASSGNNESDEYGPYSPDKIFKQSSHLCYRLRNGNPIDSSAPIELYKTGPNKGKPKSSNDPNNPDLVDESWARQFFKPGNESYSRLGTKWLSSPVQPEQVREWVDRMVGGEVYPTTIKDDRNPHPMDKLIRFETPLYRDQVKAVGHVKQVKERYVQIAQSVQAMNDVLAGSGVLNEPEWTSNVLSFLDHYFPQHLINCRTPYRCAFHDFCHTPAEALLDFVNVPEGFEVRESHHAFEREYRDKTSETDN